MYILTSHRLQRPPWRPHKKQRLVLRALYAEPALRAKAFGTPFPDPKDLVPHPFVNPNWKATGGWASRISRGEDSVEGSSCVRCSLLYLNTITFCLISEI
jgi:hypothetical protein